jgi:hypothetical protein
LILTLLTDNHDADSKGPQGISQDLTAPQMRTRVYSWRDCTHAQNVEIGFSPWLVRNSCLNHFEMTVDRWLSSDYGPIVSLNPDAYGSHLGSGVEISHE